MTLRIDAIDAHCQGQHGRVVFGGVGMLRPSGTTVLEQMRWFERDADGFRRWMLREPRGYPRACLNVVLPPVRDGVDASFVIMEQQRLYPLMSGTNAMIVATVLLETGRVPLREPVTELVLEAPAGLVRLRAECAAGRVRHVAFENVPSYAVARDLELEVRDVGRVRADVAFGGMLYAIVDAADVGARVEPGAGRRLAQLGVAIAAAARRAVTHVDPVTGVALPVEGVVLRAAAGEPGTPGAPRAHSRQTTVLGTGQMDPTPAGTGASATLALLHARGELAVGADCVIEGMFGNAFRCRIVRTADAGGVPAVVPEVGARCWITAYSQYVLADDDPFPEGLMPADLWPMAEAGSDAAAGAAGTRDRVR